MELHGRRGRETRFQQRAEVLDEVDGARAVVVGAGCAPGGGVPEVDGIHVRADDGEGAVARAVDVRDDAVLRPAVRELGDGNA